MPTYVFACPSGHQHSHIRVIADRDLPSVCPVCKGEASRDVIASMPRQTTEQEYDQPIYSDALGVHPSQIPDAQQKFPHHEFLGDGRMVIRSHTQRKRVLKELGMRDWDSYS
jgi:putative FmdB family regulatory protein